MRKISLIFVFVKSYSRQFVTVVSHVDEPVELPFLRVPSNDVGDEAEVCLDNGRAFFNYDGDYDFLNKYLPGIVNTQLKSIFDEITIEIRRMDSEK